MNDQYAEERLKQRLLDRVLLPRLLSYFRPYWGWLALALLTLLIAKGIEAMLPLFLGRAVNQMVSPEGLPVSSLTKTSLFLSGLLIFGYLCEAVTTLLKSWIGQKALTTLRNTVHTHILHLPSAFFTTSRLGRLITSTVHDTDKISQLFTETLVPILGSLFLFAGMAIGILLIDLRIGLLLLALAPLAWLNLRRFRTHSRKAYQEIRTILASLNNFVQEHTTGSHIIRAFGLRQQEKRRFDAINRDHRIANTRNTSIYALFFAGMDILQSTALIALFLALTVLITPAEGFEAGTYFSYSLYTVMFFRPMFDLAERYNTLQAAYASAERVFTLLDEAEEPSDLPDALPLTAIETIVFEDVWFRYDEEAWILKGLSLTLKAGESTALVGITGAGKTTLMKLLLRFYDAQKGRILINGRPISQYRRRDVRGQLSIVLQDPVLFSDTLANNISLGHPSISRQDVENVISYLEMEALVEKLPEGLDHPLQEGGALLSVGERQLVSLARAVAHNRTLFVLDEATANIDSRTEYQIQRALAKILPHKTSLVIAHRLSTIQDVDRIVVLQEGRVAEAGSHSELLAKKGLYEKLYRYQYEETPR